MRACMHVRLCARVHAHVRAYVYVRMYVRMYGGTQYVYVQLMYVLTCGGALYACLDEYVRMHACLYA